MKSINWNTAAQKWEVKFGKTLGFTRLFDNKREAWRFYRFDEGEPHESCSTVHLKRLIGDKLSTWAAMLSNESWSFIYIGVDGFTLARGESFAHLSNDGVFNPIYD